MNRRFHLLAITTALLLLVCAGWVVVFLWTPRWCLPLYIRYATDYRGIIRKAAPYEYEQTETEGLWALEPGSSMRQMLLARSARDGTQHLDQIVSVVAYTGSSSEEFFARVLLADLLERDADAVMRALQKSCVNEAQSVRLKALQCLRSLGQRQQESPSPAALEPIMPTLLGLLETGDEDEVVATASALTVWFGLWVPRDPSFRPVDAQLAHRVVTALRRVNRCEGSFGVWQAYEDQTRRAPLKAPPAPSP